MDPKVSRRARPIDKAYELRALSSPVRQRLVAALESLGTVSVRELAEHLGRRPGSLYFHLEKLVDAGLVLETGTRPAGRRSERLFRLVAPTLRIAGDPERPAFRAALASTCRSVTRAAERDYTRALDAGLGRLRGATRNLCLQHFHVHLTPDKRRRLVQMLEDLTAFVLDHNDPARGDLHSITALLAPVASRNPPS